MYLKTVCGLASISLVFFGIWATVENDAPHVPARLVANKNVPLQLEQQGVRDQNGREYDPSKRLELNLANESSLTRTLAMDAVLGAQAATSAPSPSASAPSEVGAVATEQMSKQDLHGSKATTPNATAVDRPFDRESPEFAAIMAEKNAAMNSLHGKLAAQALSNPEAPPVQELSNRKAPL